jgi:hypothetical protein
LFGIGLEGLLKDFFLRTPENGYGNVFCQKTITQTPKGDTIINYIGIDFHRVCEFVNIGTKKVINKLTSLNNKVK